MIKYKSKLIKWSNAFKCGVTIIDDQHNSIIKLINNLFLHADGNEELEREYFCSIIDDVVTCIKYHLATENKLLSATKYPGYIKHIKSHKTFLITLLDIIDDYKKGKKYTLATISSYLKSWVLSHIAIMDKDYFDYFKKIAIRKPDGKLILLRLDNTEKKAG